ncbi:hypothetical protein, partial [Aeromonas veronii]
MNEGSNAVFNVSLSNATEVPLVINLGLVAVSDAGNVNEGSNAVFNVSLSNATEAPLVINLGLV